MSIIPNSLGLAVVLALAGCNQVASPAEEPAVATSAQHAMDAAPTVVDAVASAETVAAPQLQAALRELWHGHVVHTRDYALAVHADDQAAATEAAAAVVANATRIGEAVAGFYGQAAGERMLELLGGHWDAVKALTDAGNAGDAAARSQAIADLTGNAGEIARFLSAANPHLAQDAVRGLLVAHGGHHAQQVLQIMADDVQGEAATWTAMQAHMDVIADALAAAIARQFPDKAT